MKERQGDDHHPRILEYHASTTLGDWLRSKDETPWCSSFINWVMAEAHGSGAGTSSALARSWIHWQQKVRLEDWQPGDVMVIRHKRGKSRRVGSRGGYHVLFPYGVDKRHIAGLGGNQSDAVQMSVFSRRKWEIVAVRRYCPSA